MKRRARTPRQRIDEKLRRALRLLTEAAKIAQSPGLILLYELTGESAEPGEFRLVETPCPPEKQKPRVRKLKLELRRCTEHLIDGINAANLPVRSDKGSTRVKSDLNRPIPNKDVVDLVIAKFCGGGLGF